MIGAIKFNSPITQQPIAIAKANRYPLRGSLFLPKPLPKNSMYGNSLSLHKA